MVAMVMVVMVVVLATLVVAVVAVVAVMLTMVVILVLSVIFFIFMIRIGQDRAEFPTHILCQGRSCESRNEITRPTLTTHWSSACIKRKNIIFSKFFTFVHKNVHTIKSQEIKIGK